MKNFQIEIFLQRYLQDYYILKYLNSCINFLLQTVPMDMLKSKLNLFKDLSEEHQSSITSIESLRRWYQTILDHMERQIVFRSRQKTSFKTKIGSKLRQYVLNLLNGLVNEIHQTFCFTQSIYSGLLERQRSIQDVIKYGVPLVREIQFLRPYMEQASLKYDIARTAYNQQQQSVRINRLLKDRLNQQSIHLDATFNSKANRDNLKYKCLQNQKYKLNMLLIAKEGNQAFLRASQKLKEYQIMQFSLVIDQCLTFLNDFTFLQKKKQQKIQEIISVSIREHEKSLGIESLKGKQNDMNLINTKNDKEDKNEIDLLCNQDINFNSFTLDLPKRCYSEDLQRITERQEYLESDNSPSQPRTYESCSPSP